MFLKKAVDSGRGDFSQPPSLSVEWPKSSTVADYRSFSTLQWNCWRLTAFSGSSADRNPAPTVTTQLHSGRDFRRIPSLSGKPNLVLPRNFCGVGETVGLETSGQLNCTDISRRFKLSLGVVGALLFSASVAKVIFADSVLSL